MTRRSYLRLELPGPTEAHRPTAVGARFESLAAPIIPLADLWERPPTREVPQRALHPHPKLERLAGIQRRPLAELEADVHLASSRAFRRSLAEGAAIVPWEEIIDAYCLSCAFVDVRLGWGEEEAAE